MVVILRWGPGLYLCCQILFVAEVQEEIDAMLEDVPVLQEHFSILDKIGSGMQQVLVEYLCYNIE